MRTTALGALGLVVLASTAPLGASRARAADAPSGQMTLAHQVSIAPRWFDPAESEGLITPFIFYYEDLRLKGP